MITWALMDHLGIKKFMVMGFCIGGPSHLELAAACAGTCRRSGVGAAERIASGDARPVL